MSNLWDIPAKPQIGDPTPDAVYLAVGKALSIWEGVELELSVVYAATLRVPPEEACKRPEYAKEATFIGRIAVIERAWEEMVPTICDQALEADFSRLIRDVRGLSLRRNDIAHGMVRPHPDERAESGYLLLPAMYRDKRFNASGDPDFAYSAAEINQLRMRFQRMILHCVQVHYLIAQGVDPYPELRLRPPLVPLGDPPPQMSDTIAGSRSDLIERKRRARRAATGSLWPAYRCRRPVTRYLVTVRGHVLSTE